ncbi:MAG: hypothetical protein WC477_02950 [Patescibacteria group bacterium]
MADTKPYDPSFGGDKRVVSIDRYRRQKEPTPEAALKQQELETNRERLEKQFNALELKTRMISGVADVLALYPLDASEEQRREALLEAVRTSFEALPPHIQALAEGMVPRIEQSFTHENPESMQSVESKEDLLSHASSETIQMISSFWDRVNSEEELPFDESEGLSADILEEKRAHILELLTTPESKEPSKVDACIRVIDEAIHTVRRYTSPGSLSLLKRIREDAIKTISKDIASGRLFDGERAFFSYLVRYSDLIEEHPVLKDNVANTYAVREVLPIRVVKSPEKNTDTLTDESFETEEYSRSFPFINEQITAVQLPQELIAGFMETHALSSRAEIALEKIVRLIKDLRLLASYNASEDPNDEVDASSEQAFRDANEIERQILRVFQMIRRIRSLEEVGTEDEDRFIETICYCVPPSEYADVVLFARQRMRLDPPMDLLQKQEEQERKDALAEYENVAGFTALTS